MHIAANLFNMPVPQLWEARLVQSENIKVLMPFRERLWNEELLPLVKDPPALEEAECMIIAR